ncbi:MAG: hypothetical protein K6E95_09120 [Lachnospiraceae bacterium]|nr:hypothetical protein [Lachnospiraceae bacterium]
MKNKALRAAGMILTIVSLGFICYRIARLDLSDIKIDFSVSSVLILLLALILQTFSVIILGILFARNVGKGTGDREVPLKDAVMVYCRANLGKYIPGNVFQYVERNLFFSSYGIRHLDTVIASVLEILCLIVGACILSAVFGDFNVIREAAESYGNFIPVICIIIVAVLIAGIFVLKKKKKSLADIAARIGERGGARLVIIDVIAYTLILLLMGAVAVISYYAFMVPGETQVEPLGLLGAYIAAWLCGFVIIGAPGGIGVREAVFTLIYINTPYLDTVLALSVLLRVISVIADIFAYFVAKICDYYPLHKKD